MHIFHFMISFVLDYMLHVKDLHPVSYILYKNSCFWNRRALFLLQYFLHSGSRSAVLKMNAVPIAAQSLASQDPDVKEAALMALVEAGRDSEGCSELRKV